MELGKKKWIDPRGKGTTNLSLYNYGLNLTTLEPTKATQSDLKVRAIITLSRSKVIPRRRPRHLM